MLGDERDAVQRRFVEAAGRRLSIIVGTLEAELMELVRMVEPAAALRGRG